MTWQSLYRRYRPRRFVDVRGQDHVVTALRNAVRDARVSHAYLFSGPRGTGKTTCARIVAKALNCERPVDGEPCLECDSCVAIEAGASYDLHELDAASNNGVDAVRDLITRAAMGTPGRAKVYILDEVHMLSTPASNALLKTLEEPPDHVVFVLATTDPQKVLSTIRSRTQHFEFDLIGAEVMAAHVRWVAADAGLEIDDTVIDHVVRVGGGSARDTLSALDQVLAAGGITDRAGGLDELVAALVGRDPGAALGAVHEAVRSGRDPRVLAERLVARMRDAFLASVGVTLDHLPDADRARVAQLVDGAERPFLTRAIEVLGTTLVDMRQAADARITLEAALVRLADPTADTSTSALLDRIERLERALAVAGADPAGAERTPTSSGPARPAPSAQPAGAVGSAPDSSPEPPRSLGPEEARRRLTERRAGGRPGPSGPAGSGPERRGPDAPAPGPSRPPVPPRPQAAAGARPTTPPLSPPTVAAGAPAPPVPSGALPDLDDLRAAWRDVLVDRLPKLAKARFAAGRFRHVDGSEAVEFALPSTVYLAKCEEYRDAVEAVLAAHFGRPVPVRLVVDAAAGERSRPTDRPPSGPEPAEADIDLADLVDAPTEPTRTPIDRLTDAFPGAELLEDDQ